MYLAEVGVRCYVDGPLSHRVSAIYQDHTWSELDRKPRAFGNFICKVEGPHHRQELIHSAFPNVVITSSGTGESFAYDYLEYGLGRPGHFFAATSHIFPDTPIDRIQKAVVSGKEVFLRSEFKGEVREKRTPVVAEIDHFGISRHGTLGDFLLILQELVDLRGGQKLDRVVLYHGISETIEKAKNLIGNFVKKDGVAIGYAGTTIELD